MIKLPTYIDCFEKFVSYLGLDYSETKKSTDKFRMGELREFIEQGDRYTYQYLPQIFSLFAGEDKEKQAAIKVCFIISESLARFLTIQNYYTIASNKRATWALLIFYYIPHLACLISIYKKDFGIPECLMKHDFMLPYSDAGKFVSPSERLRDYLSPFKKLIKGERDNEKNVLATYLYKLDSEVTPSYQTKQKIINQLKTLPELKEEINEIETIFHATIMSGKICNNLESFLGDKSYVLSLVNYFKNCLKTSDRLIREEIENLSLFEDFFSTYVDYYQNEIIFTTAELINPYMVELNEPKENPIDYEELKENRDSYREQLFITFDSFLYTTTSETRDQLDEIDTQNFTKGILRYSRLTEAESIDYDHEEIVGLLTDLEHIFSSSEKPLQENRISQLLNKIESHKFYSIYEHEFLYYSGLNDLGNNDFPAALEKLNLASHKCKQATACETQARIAKILIILRLLTDNSISYSHLNSEIRMIIDSEPEKVELTPLDGQYESANNIEKDLLKHTSKKGYLEKIMDEIKCFNTQGYCRYEGVDAKKYNPFKKLDDLIYDIYDLYKKMNHIQDSQKARIQRVIDKLMRSSKPAYSIKDKLITLHQYSAADVFDEITFSSIVFFCVTSNIDTPNIIKLANDRETFTLISKAINNPGRSRS